MSALFAVWGEKPGDAAPTSAIIYAAKDEAGAADAFVAQMGACGFLQGEAVRVARLSGSMLFDPKRKRE